MLCGLCVVLPTHAGGLSSSRKSSNVLKSSLVTSTFVRVPRSSWTHNLFCDKSAAPLKTFVVEYIVQNKFQQIC